MIEEARRRAYLTAMQVVSWLPRSVLPFAAPSRAELLQPLPEPQPQVVAPVVAAAPAAVREEAPAPRPSVEVPRPAVQMPKPMIKAEPAATEEDTPAPTRATPVAPPRFALQLLRAGDCALLVELPTGESFQSRDPAYLLLKDLLRAAGLPDSPQQVGDGSPIRWPLLSRGNLDQGPDAARDYVQGVLAGQLESQPCACLWLVGLPAVRFAGEADAEAFNRELTIDGLGAAWALPGLELLMDEPERKRELWQAMRRVMQRWKPSA
ncbi:energy transducer TonB [Pseudomonas sp. R-28-1W-6]|uniref:energy transducer TonB n=1 Tax=Pseudomonas sp. R-28-1W-6 TaxID=2650101 RepID=UPI0013652BC0|nr:energy transducer TonB [Pseudomonas sp. R-28-1W-6]MWV12793.1 energy transducer TonB [Pseudomonas sp. R-28-1W-6]